MFLVELTYKVNLEKVDPYLEDHISFLNKYRDLGIFILAGRKLPRDGGLIIVNTDSRESLDSILNEDPFVINDLANLDIKEFVPSIVTKELDFLKKS